MRQQELLIQSNPLRKPSKTKSILKIPILTYHSIDDSGSIISTKPETFRRQIKYLNKAGYKTISLDALKNVFAKQSHAPEKSFVLTFDDGFQNFYTEAFPVLEEYNFQATVFLVTDHCGRNNDWAGNPPNLPKSKLLCWREIKELSGCGIEFGAHSRTHPDLTRLSAAHAADEIIKSKDAIENSLGKKVETFAYPYGSFNHSVRKIVAENFEAACSTNLGKAQAESNFFSLERIDSYYLSNPLIFSSLSSAKFDFYLGIRQALRRFKKIILNN